MWRPLLIIGGAMLVVPTLAGALFDGLGPAVGGRLSAADVETLRVGVRLIAQGAALVGFTFFRVTGRGGLGLPPGALGLAFGPPAAPWRREVVVGLVAGIVLTALNVIGSGLSQKLFGLFMDPELLSRYVAQESEGVAEALGAGSTGWIGLLLPFVAVVIAPVSEEVFFRGYLYPVLNARFPQDPSYGVFWSAAVFALVHFYVVHFIPVLLIGIALALLYRGRRSLVAPVVAHATANFIVTAAALLV